MNCAGSISVLSSAAAPIALPIALAPTIAADAEDVISGVPIATAAAAKAASLSFDIERLLNPGSE
jgi:hypothetical protein